MMFGGCAVEGELAREDGGIVDSEDHRTFRYQLRCLWTDYHASQTNRSFL